MMHQCGQEGTQVRSDALHGGQEPGRRGLMHHSGWQAGRHVQASRKSDASQPEQQEVWVTCRLSMMHQSRQEGAWVRSDALHGGRELGRRGLMHQILYWWQPHLYV